MHWENHRLTRYAFIATIFVAIVGYLVFQFSYLFQSKEFTGKFQGISLSYECIGDYVVSVIRDDGTQINVTLPLVINPYPSKINERKHIDQIFDFARNKSVRVRVIQWKGKDSAIGFIYLNNKDIAELLLREGHLVVSMKSIEDGGLDSTVLEKFHRYVEIENIARKGNAGIWGRFE